MDKKQRRRLKDLLAQLDTGERNRLIKRATRMRKAAMRSRPAGGRAPQLDDFLCELLEAELGDNPGDRASAWPGTSAGPNASSAASVATGAASGDLRGTVVGVAAGVCRVRLAGRPTATADDAPHPLDVDATLPDDLARRQRSDLAVGDEVVVERLGDSHRVNAVLPRRSLLSRADPHLPRRRRAIAANIDLVVVVIAAKAPPLHPRLIDRYLVAAQDSGARPLLVVNKIDLLDAEERHATMARLQPYRSLGLPVLPCSAAGDEGLETVREELAGRTCVFVGQSGVGKSSLLNALGGSAATGAVRDGDGRGRHTTTGSALHELPGDIRVIDTPGIRRFTLDGADPTTIAAGFAEFASHAAECRYRDCTHTHEPGCAVRRAVAAGTIPRSRYVSYRKLLLGDGDDPQPTDGEPHAKTAAGAGGAHFTCANCGRPISLEATGSRHRNHCPHCLHSVHLDDRPGDRSSCCGGLMEPVSVWVRRSGEWAVVHRCRDCGRLSSNRIAGDDNELLLLSLAVRPLSAPPFPLDGLAGGAGDSADGADDESGGRERRGR